MKEKIGFLETWNDAAGRAEFSITRLQMAACTLFNFVFFWWFFIVKENPVNWNNLLLVLIFLLASIAPKAIKDITIQLVNKRG